jgi:hypothetical protein
MRIARAATQYLVQRIIKISGKMSERRTEFHINTY